MTEHAVERGRSSAIPAAARPYQGQPAGVVTRVVASAIDAVVVMVIAAAIYGGIAGVSFLIRPRNFSWPSGLGWSIPVVILVISVPYLALSWATVGRTAGDSLLGLRVADRRGRRLGVGRAVARAVLCALFPIGLFWVAVSRANRSVQDILLRTAVVYAWTPRVTPADATTRETADSPGGSS